MDLYKKKLKGILVLKKYFIALNINHLNYRIDTEREFNKTLLGS